EPRGKHRQQRDRHQDDEADPAEAGAKQAAQHVKRPGSAKPVRRHRHDCAGFCRHQLCADETRIRGSSQAYSRSTTMFMNTTEQATRMTTPTMTCVSRARTASTINEPTPG